MQTLKDKGPLAALVAVVVAILGLGAMQLFQTNSVEPQANASPTGATFSTAKIAEIIFAPTTGTATSTSILNSDANDRIIEDTFVACTSVGTSKTAYTGAGLANLTFTFGTTSSSAPASVTSIGNVLASNDVSTSSPDFYVSSTTVANATFVRTWASGSYLSIFSNATNTASCAVGVHYLAF